MKSKHKEVNILTSLTRVSLNSSINVRHLYKIGIQNRICLPVETKLKANKVMIRTNGRKKWKMSSLDPAFLPLSYFYMSRKDFSTDLNFVSL